MNGRARASLWHGLPRGRALLWWAGAGAGLLGVLAGDLWTPYGFVHGLLYLPVLLLAFWSGRPRLPVTVAALAVAFTVIGFALTPGPLDQAVAEFAWLNRAASCLALALTYWLGSALLRSRVQGREADQAVVEARRALAEHVRLLEVASKTGRLGGWSVDLRSGAVSWSQAVRDIFGVDQDAPADFQRVNEGLTADDRARMEAAFRACERAGVPFDEEVRLVRPDGSDVWVRSIGRAERDEQGRVVLVQGALQDISSLKLAAQSAEEMQRRFRSLADYLPIMVAAAEVDGRPVYFNRRLQDYSGLGEAALLGDPGFLSVIHPDDRRAVQRGQRDAVGAGLPYAMEARLRHRDGHYEWFLMEGSPVRDHAGRITMWYGGAVNIDRQKRAEAEARAVSERLGAILESITDPFFSVDADWRVTYVNEPLLALSGRPREELLERDVRVSSPGLMASAFGSECTAAMRDRRAVRFRLEHNGRWLDVGVYPTPDGGLAVHGRDITEQLRLEGRVAQSQRLESIGQLTGGVAHDFNNLLTVILGNAELLAASLPEGGRQAVMAGSIARAAESGASLTQRLLAFARRQMLEPRVVDVNQLVVDMDLLLRRALGEHVELEVVRGAGLWQALVDPAQLESMLLNLCLNARDAMPEGGRLTLETANAYVGEEYLESHPEAEPGQYVMLAVSDTGSGIAPEHLERIFEPFFSTKDKDGGQGTGLGLAMVYGFVRQSRGIVNVYSEVGQGTTFRVYLPRATSPGAKPDPARHTSIQGGHETILVVEDDDMVRRFAQEQLAALGYRVLEAGSGSEALDALDRADHVDLLFTDVVMPGGMNGRELAEAVRARSPRTRVLFSSGYTQNAIVHHGRVDPGVHLLPKPYRRDTLARRVREVLDAD